MVHKTNRYNKTSAAIGYFIQWSLAVYLVLLIAGCTQPYDKYGYGGTPPIQLWHAVDYDYRTNDLATAYRLSLRARNKLEYLSRIRPKDLNYPYCLAILNGRLYLMARSLGDTNSANQFLLESGYYFNEGRKQSSLPVTNYSGKTIEHYITVYDSKLHPNQTNGVP